MDQTEIQKIWDAIAQLQPGGKVFDHFHNGFDASRVYWKDINQRKMYVAHTLYGADAATAADYSIFFPYAPFALNISGFWEIHTTAGSDGSAVTLQLEKLTGTTAPGGGVSVLGSTINLKGTANTAQVGTLTTTLANRNLAKGDRLALKLAGTPTSLTDVSTLTELTVI